MPATNQNIEHWAGDTATIKIPVLDGAGAPVNLAGASARWWMAPNARSRGTDVLIKKSTGGGGLVIAQSGSIWTLVISIASADTEDLNPGPYYHEAEVIDAAADIGTVTTGKFVLQPALITNP